MNQPVPARLTGGKLWGKTGKTFTAERNLEAVLGAARSIPLKYWKPRFLFSGAKDEEIFTLSYGEFPRNPETGKTHPIFALKPLPNNTGFTVCPCSSKRPFGVEAFRYIRECCILLRTGAVQDRNSYLIEAITFNIPRSVASSLRFRGEAPEECLATGKSRPGKSLAP